MSACVACGGVEWSSLPNPRADRSVRSDWRVLDMPLDKHACASCGLVTRPTVVPLRMFESGYDLYDHPPGMPRERARQDAYADWLAAHVTATPRVILDLGCGNGSLLLALGRRWPDAVLRGIDPSPESVARARAVGIDARCGSVGVAGVEPADLVVSVNVIEHVEDPVGFMHALASLISQGGTALVVCPDGGRAWLELLFVDHLWSFTPLHLARMAERAGLSAVSGPPPPPALDCFQLVQLRPSTQAPSTTWSCEGASELTRIKRTYLDAWSALDDALVRRCADAPALTCFGTGEAAALLRAYAPRVWRRVTDCVADEPEQDRFGNLPVVHYRGGPLDQPVLLAVRPAAQPAVADRLLHEGCQVIRWDDCIRA